MYVLSIITAFLLPAIFGIHLISLIILAFTYGREYFIIALIIFIAVLCATALIQKVRKSQGIYKPAIVQRLSIFYILTPAIIIIATTAPIWVNRYMRDYQAVHSATRSITPNVAQRLIDEDAQCDIYVEYRSFLFNRKVLLIQDLPTKVFAVQDASYKEVKQYVENHRTRVCLPEEDYFESDVYYENN